MSRYFKRRKGFGLIELLVSLSIIGVVVSIVLFSQEKFTWNLTISNYADDLSTTFFEAQTYGTAVKGQGSNFAPFGVSVRKAHLDSLGLPSWTMYRDTNLNQQYDGDHTCTEDSYECGTRSEIPMEGRGGVAQGFTISSICFITGSGPENCSYVSKVDVTYSRPNKDADIKFFVTDQTPITVEDAIGVNIIFSGPEGLTRSVTVYKSGQISVQ